MLGARLEYQVNHGRPQPELAIRLPPVLAHLGSRGHPCIAPVERSGDARKPPPILRFCRIPGGASDRILLHVWLDHWHLSIWTAGWEARLLTNSYG
jgi:hypothetical protein